MMVNKFGWSLLATITFFGVVANAEDSSPPNFLIIMADDCTHTDLPLYGGENAATPNIDAMVRQGLVFNRAYVSEAMCQPCRSELYSGQHLMGNGAAWNQSGSRPVTTSIPHLSPGTQSEPRR